MLLSVLNLLYLYIIFDESMILQDLIHVIESKTPKNYGDYFLRQIVKVCQIILFFICINSSTANHRECFMFVIFLKKF